MLGEGLCIEGIRAQIGPVQGFFYSFHRHAGFLKMFSFHKHGIVMLDSIVLRLIFL